MTWAWVGTVWMFVVFIVDAIVAVALLVTLALLVVYTVKTIVQGVRAAAVAREDAHPEVRAVPAAPRVLAPVKPPRDNVTPIFSSDDEK